MTDDNHDEGHEPASFSDAVNRLRFTLNPHLYTDESSTVDELLWQLVLEARAARYWIKILCVVLTGLLIAALLVATIIIG